VEAPSEKASGAGAASCAEVAENHDAGAAPVVLHNSGELKNVGEKITKISNFARYCHRGKRVLFGNISVSLSKTRLPNQLPDPTSPSVTTPAGAGVAPSVAANH
jgi:hypothetical protein